MLISMKVSFHATIRDAAGVSDIEIDATSIRNLLVTLQSRFGDRLAKMLVKDDKLREDVVILVNGQNIAHTGGIDTPLRSNDDVAIFPPISGG